jgi:hypothetical protein
MRSVKRVKAVFIYNFYSEHFLVWKISFQFSGLPRNWANFKTKKNASVITSTSRPALGPTQLPIQWVPGALSLGIKRPGREADQSAPPSSAEVKNAWSYNSTPTIRLHGVLLS